MSKIVKILSTITILFLLLYEVKFNKIEFIAVWNSLHYGYVLLVLPFVLVVLSIKAYRWQRIIFHEGYSYSYYKVLRAYLSSYSVGVVTPGRLGELIKVYNLRDDIKNIDTVSAFRTVVLDRLFDMFFLLWFGLSGVLFYSHIFGKQDKFLILLIVVLVIYIALSFWNFVHSSLNKKRSQSNKILEFIDNCLRSMFLPGNIVSWILSGIAYLIFFIGIKILFFSIGIQIPLIEVGFIISMIGLLLLLPISVAGFGTREAGLVYLLSFYTIDAETAICFSLLQFSIFFICGGLIGLIFWFYTPIPLSFIREDYRNLWLKLSTRIKTK